MNTTDKATPRPWKWESKPYAIEIIAANGDLIAEASRLDNAEEAHANAALIIRAVNEYDALCAVAEAAKVALYAKSANELDVAANNLRDSLSRLAAIRKGTK